MLWRKPQPALRPRLQQAVGQGWMPPDRTSWFGEAVGVPRSGRLWPCGNRTCCSVGVKCPLCRLTPDLHADNFTGAVERSSEGSTLKRIAVSVVSAATLTTLLATPTAALELDPVRLELVDILATVPAASGGIRRGIRTAGNQVSTHRAGFGFPKWKGPRAKATSGFMQFPWTQQAGSSSGDWRLRQVSQRRNALEIQVGDIQRHQHRCLTGILPDHRSAGSASASVPSLSAACG